MSASAERPELRPGDTLAGRYRLTALIGEGGMGAVWEARQITTDKPVAIKVLKRPHGSGAGLPGEGADAARFLREARVAASLTHRNIIQVFDFWDADAGGPVFMVMELLHGETLAEVLARGALGVDETLAVMLPVTAAVQAAHARGIVHRDLKPENVFFARAQPNEAPEIKVLDFGLAKPFVADAAAQATALTQTGSVLGTPYYMAPEQVYGEKDIDDRADVWALGVMLYECLSGTKPFVGENFGQIFRKLTRGELRPLKEAAPSTPVALVALVARMMAHERAGRPTSTEVHDALTAMSAVAPTATTQLMRVVTKRMPSHPPAPAASAPAPAKPAPPLYAPAPGALPARTVVDASISVRNAPDALPKTLLGVGAALAALGAVALGAFLALRPAPHVRIEVPPPSAALGAEAPAAPAPDGARDAAPATADDAAPTPGSPEPGASPASPEARAAKPRVTAPPLSKPAGAKPRAAASAAPKDPLSSGRF